MQYLHLLRQSSYCILVPLVTGLYGCSTSPTILTEYESRLGVQDELSREFHSSLYYPKGLALQYPGYLVGIQKAAQEKVMGPAMIFPSFLDPAPRYFDDGEKATKWGLGSINLLRKLQTDSKAMFVNHVTRFSFVQDKGPRSSGTSSLPYTYIDSCFLYNAFRSPLFSASRSADNSQAGARTWRDLSGVIAWKDCRDAPGWEGNSPDLKSNAFYANGEVAIRALARAAALDLKNDGYTHVLILVMGWNTAQDEAVRNFNDLAGNLLEAARESEAAKIDGMGEPRLPFRPLVIGVSWPSYWTEGVANVFSYPNKAKDADEIGITWLNLLVNRELPDAMTTAGVNVPVVLVGHSFGARVVTRVAAASPALRPKDGAEVAGLHSGANVVIGLQGAVSINRFWPNAGGEPPGDEGAPLRDYSTLKTTRFAFTASSHDSAAGGPVFWFDPTGSIKSYQLACNSKSDDWRNSVFRCFSAHDTSGLNTSLAGRKRWEGFAVCENGDPRSCRKVGDKLPIVDRRVFYLDTSDGITEFNTIGTGGNAHSDIYRLPMGRLLWMLITSLAPIAY